MLWWLAPWLLIPAIFVVGALLAPPLAWAIDPWWDNPFARFVRRALLITALLAMVPLICYNWSGFGLRWAGHRPGRQIVWGLLGGLLFVVVAAGCMMLAGFREFSEAPTLSVVGKALAAAVAVSLLEEIIFRGGFQTAFAERLGPIVGLAAASLLFALVHFLEFKDGFDPQPVGWLSGFEGVGRILEPLAVSTTYGPRLIVYTLVGLCLGLCFLWTRSLWLPIGAHAGVIIGQQVFNAISDVVPGTRDTRWLGAYPGDLLESPLTIAWLIVVACLLWIKAWPNLRGEKSFPNPSTPAKASSSPDPC